MSGRITGIKMIKEKDFVEIEYTAKIKDDDIVFDTTDPKVASREGIKEQKQDYGPIIICVGEGQVIGGLDKNLVGKDVDKEYTFEIGPEEGFGKKSAKLIRLVPTGKFRQNDIQPVPGMQVNIDDSIGIIKHVSGGRTLVDFNHPLSGKVLIYDVKVKRTVDDDKEKLDNYIKLTFGVKGLKVDVKDGKGIVEVKSEMPKEITKELEKKVKEVIPGIRSLEFRKAEKKEDQKKSQNDATDK